MKLFLIFALAFYGAASGGRPVSQGSAEIVEIWESARAGLATVFPFFEPETTMIFAGDVMLSRSIRKAMVSNGDWKYPFLRVGEMLSGADMVFANLENPISERGTKVGSIYSFRADPRVIEGLTFAGLDVVSLANNHIWDYGPVALRDTLAILEEKEIGFVGAGKNYDEAHRPFIKEAQGMRVAFLAYTNLIPRSATRTTSEPAVAYLDLPTVIADVASARELADIVVVSLHWGEEYKTHHNLAQEGIAKAVIDAGATLVVGHHPHVVQEVERYNDGYIAYSLGNFVFDQNFSEDTSRGLLLKVVLKGKRIERVESIGVAFTPDFQPFVVE